MDFKNITLSFLLFLCVKISLSQDSLVYKYDTGYYDKYPHKLIVTPFLVKNLTAFSLANPSSNEKIPYYSNSPLGVGLRLGYDWLALSASFSTGIIDPEFSKQRGKTKTLNLNTSFLAKSFLVDVYFQNHKSMFLRSKNIPFYTEGKFYVRSDIRTRLLGATGSYVFNGKKFSARPVFRFDTRQKKSAGSLLAGVEFLMGDVQSDSSLVPKAFENEASLHHVNKMQYLLIGPNIGYGYNFVFGKNFFVTALATFNADAAKIKESYTDESLPNSSWKFAPGFNFRGGVGYNTPDWEVAFSYFTKRIYMVDNNQQKKLFFCVE